MTGQALPDSTCCLSVLRFAYWPQRHRARHQALSPAGCVESKGFEGRHHGAGDRRAAGQGAEAAAAAGQGRRGPPAGTRDTCPPCQCLPPPGGRGSRQGCLAPPAVVRSHHLFDASLRGDVLSQDSVFFLAIDTLSLVSCLDHCPTRLDRLTSASSQGPPSGVCASRFPRLLPLGGGAPDDGLRLLLGRELRNGDGDVGGSHGRRR